MYNDQMEKLRVSKRQSEIQGVLKTVMQQERKVLVWQREAGTEERKINYAQINNLNFENRSIGLVPIEKNFEEMDRNITLYFRSEFSSLLFKSTENLINKKMIIVPFPKEVRLIEKRNKERYKFKRNTIPQIDIIKTDSKQAQVKLNVNLIDISQSGAGIVVSAANHRLFKEGHQIQITAVEGRRLPAKISGRIKHITFLKGKNTLFSGFYKIGVAFDDEIVLDPILERVSG